MVLILVNVLHIPVTIFTSIENLPIICLTPTLQETDTARPLLLTFCQDGPRYYDYAMPITHSTKIHELQKKKSNVFVVERVVSQEGHVLLEDVHVLEAKTMWFML